MIKKIQKIPGARGGIVELILKKYILQILIIFILVILSLISHFLPLNKKVKPVSLDTLVPKNFVLMPIELSNGKDIINIIGSYGVVDLYAYSKTTGLPEKQAGGAIKILPPETEEGGFTALVPEKEAIRLFKYSEPFYAVIQNPNKTGSKIYKNREKKSLIVIEENF